jgi:replication initiation protein RepC
MKMLGNFITTPFGRRSMTLAHLRAQKQAQELEPGKVVDKWQLYRWLCEAKDSVGVSDRSLAVLNSLLSFLPDTDLSEDKGLVVFPSNAQLSLRAHGMAPATLRRHLAALVECGLITRKDSPNGKRYSRKDRAGEIAEAFGFSLAPLLARAEELEAAAQSVRAAAMALRLMRERITLHRRDIAKLIEVAIEEKVAGDWTGLWTRLREIVEAIPRRATTATLEPILANLINLHDDVAILLEKHVNNKNASANESQNERQQQNSNTESISNLESLNKSRPQTIPSKTQEKSDMAKIYPLSLVIKACPEINDHAIHGIRNWREFIQTASQIKGYLNISPSAYEDALNVLGPENTAIVIACILQRAQTINSAGGYLRSLTKKARGGRFSVGPILTAGMQSNSSTATIAK